MRFHLTLSLAALEAMTQCHPDPSGFSPWWVRLGDACTEAKAVWQDDGTCVISGCHGGRDEAATALLCELEALGRMLGNDAQRRGA